MNTSYILTAYIVYLPVTILLTWYVAHTLFKNGRIFMLDIFHGKEEIASATNKLFEVGFYLLNVGFALWILQIDAELLAPQSVVEVLSKKIGGFSIYLGVMLFFNLYMFFRGRKASRANIKFAEPVKIVDASAHPA
jgi:predicted PurR-regulated permease PerM